MVQDLAKMALAESAMTEAVKAHSEAVAEFLDPQKQRANVVGLATGMKWRNGEPTGEPALLVLVTHKVPKDQLRKADLIPSQLQDMKTDVLAIGHPVAGGN